jgi:ABC-2 type transport system ATP-binding protein
MTETITLKRNMIEVENLTKYYGEILALDNVSFNIRRGDIVGFLGPNGAGKTTAMRILTCYLSLTGGTAKVCGYDILKHPLEVKRRIGYLPEMNPLYEEMGVIEYLEFIAEIHRMDRGIRKKKIRYVIEVCGLKDVLEQNIGELSKGYRQRVGFAQAILHDPEVLIMDEPTSGLDPNQAVEIRNLIRELKKEKTVILSTHILSEVQAVCDRVLIINKARIVASGTTAELQTMVQGRERIYVELKTKENPEKILRALTGVESVVLTKKDSGQPGYEIESTVDLREELYNLAVSKRWTIIELHRLTVSLEEIFRKLTT